MGFIYGSIFHHNPSDKQLKLRSINTQMSHASWAVSTKAWQFTQMQSNQSMQIFNLFFWILYIFSQGSPGNHLPILDSARKRWEKKSFVYSQSNWSLLTHPPQLLASQHNGWTNTPKNQSVNIKRSLPVQQWSEWSSVASFSQKTCTLKLRDNKPVKKKERKNIKNKLLEKEGKIRPTISRKHYYKRNSYLREG